jgi:hypothetical protein
MAPFYEVDVNAATSRRHTLESWIGQSAPEVAQLLDDAGDPTLA